MPKDESVAVVAVVAAKWLISVLLCNIVELRTKVIRKELWTAHTH